jgi:hypothetical protein
LHGNQTPRTTIGFKATKSFPTHLRAANRLAAGLSMLITGGKFLEDLVRTAVFDRDQLESLMAAAFELLGKPEAQAQELAKSILKAAERPQSVSVVR